MTLKFSDLKPGDKINYRLVGGEWYSDIGTYVKSEGDKYWFKWDVFGNKLLYLWDDDTIELQYDKTHQCSPESKFTEDELIEELRNRGFKGTLTKTFTQTITL